MATRKAEEKDWFIDLLQLFEGIIERDPGSVKSILETLSDATGFVGVRFEKRRRGSGRGLLSFSNEIAQFIINRNLK